MAWPSSDKVRIAATNSNKMRNGMAKFEQGEEWHGQVGTR